MVPRHKLAAKRAQDDDISVCLRPGRPRRCDIKGKTINMELDSAGPTAFKVTDSPLPPPPPPDDTMERVGGSHVTHKHTHTH